MADSVRFTAVIVGRYKDSAPKDTVCREVKKRISFPPFVAVRVSTPETAAKNGVFKTGNSTLKDRLQSIR